MTNNKITTMKAAMRAVGLPDFFVWRGSFMVRRRAAKRAALVGDKPGILRASAIGAAVSARATGSRSATFYAA